jgi:HEAT repeat protein
MPRLLTLLAVTFYSVASTPLLAAPGDNDTIVRGKTVAEWFAILEGNREAGQHRLALHALGAGADHPLVWRQMTKVRQGALLILEIEVGPAKSKKVLPAVVAALRNDSDPVIRAAAAQSLGRLPARCLAAKQDFTPGLDALFGALRTDGSAAVREAAAIALGKLSPDDVRPATPTLIERLKDDSAAVRAAAADTLRRMGREAVEAVPALREAVEDEKNEPLTRFQAAQALAKIGPPEAVAALPGLQKVLAGARTPVEVRTAILSAVARFGKDAGPAVPQVGKLLTDEDSSVELRGAAVTALEALGPVAAPAVADLKKAAKDKDKFVRGMAMRTFAKIGKELGSQLRDAVALVKQGTDDPILEVRLAAIETLGNFGADVLGEEAKDVLERLTQLKDSSEKEVREAAQNALEKLKS